MTFLGTSDFLKMLSKFKMASEVNSSFFWGAQKFKVRNYSNFKITFPRCVGDFLRFCLSAYGRHGSNAIFCGRKNLKSEIMQMLQSLSSRYGDVQVIF